MSKKDDPYHSALSDPCINGHAALAEVSDWVKKLKEFISATTEQRACGGLFYQIDKLIEKQEKLLFACPLHCNDKVEFVKQLNLPKDHGWYPSRHMFQPGRPATVVGVEWDNGYTVSIKFDNETYIHFHSGEEIPNDSGYVYCRIKVDKLRKL